jgi:NitT/TauT family transport system ATP-binding protein
LVLRGEEGRAKVTAAHNVAQRESAISITGARKQFGNGVVAVEGVDLEVRKGEFVSLVGASGCGKSTLLRMIAGLTHASDGEVELNGTPVTGPRQDVGLMFQRPTLLPWRTALNNVLLPRRLGVGVQDGDLARAEETLSLLGLRGFENTYPAHLSGGMQQRVALARLLMIGADILLLDEPFAAVDEITRERLNVELMKLHHQTGATVVLVTHNITEAVMLADRVFVMTPHPGRVARVLDVPFGRPRTPEVVKDPEFVELAFEARGALGPDHDTAVAA